MPDYTKYPQIPDLQQLLQSAAMLDVPLSDAQKRLHYQAALDDAISEFEHDTGYQPFLAGAASQRKFDPPGPNQGYNRYWTLLRGGGWRLMFDNGMVGAPSSVLTNVAYGDPGTLRTLGQDFFLYPTNAAVEGRPYQYLTFAFHVWGVPQSTVITAQWGYATTLPSDAWFAILCKAALTLMPQIIAELTGGLQQLAQGTDKWAFSPKGAFADVITQWEKTYLRARHRYLREVDNSVF